VFAPAADADGVSDAFGGDTVVGKKDPDSVALGGITLLVNPTEGCGATPLFRGKTLSPMAANGPTPTTAFALVSPRKASTFPYDLLMKASDEHKDKAMFQQSTDCVQFDQQRAPYTALLSRVPGPDQPPTIGILFLVVLCHTQHTNGNSSCADV
jgi:hypothetical protein